MPKVVLSDYAVRRFSYDWNKWNFFAVFLFNWNIYVIFDKYKLKIIN